LQDYWQGSYGDVGEGDNLTCIHYHGGQRERALRYWWLHSALNDEINDRGELTVADFGCSRGHFKQFFGESPSAKWIGFDWAIDEPHLQSLGYENALQCDFDQEIPYPSNSADVVIFSHVIEHLPRPEFTLSEIARILRPGGILLAGSPVVPFPFSRLRDWRHQSKHERGEIKKAGISIRWTACDGRDNSPTPG